MALLRNVQVQASGCVDEVAFLFMGGLPGWTAGYRTGPLSEDPSGRPVDVGGTAHLVISFNPASGVDLSSASLQPAQTYDGPAAMTPSEPSQIVGLRRLGDFEAVMRWAIGLAGTRPFEVVSRGDQIVLRLATSRTRTTRCGIPDSGVTVGYPNDWYAELSDQWACRYFNPSPFVVYPASDAVDWTVTVALADEPADRVVAQMRDAGTTMQSTPATVAGLPATILDITENGRGMHPAGYRYRMYVVATTPKALLIVGKAGPPGLQADRTRESADLIAGRIRLS